MTQLLTPLTKTPLLPIHGVLLIICFDYGCWLIVTCANKKKTRINLQNITRSEKQEGETFESGYYLPLT